MPAPISGVALRPRPTILPPQPSPKRRRFPSPCPSPDSSASLSSRAPHERARAGLPSSGLPAPFPWCSDCRFGTSLAALTSIAGLLPRAPVTLLDSSRWSLVLATPLVPAELVQPQIHPSSPPGASSFQNDHWYSQQDTHQSQGGSPALLLQGLDLFD